MMRTSSDLGLSWSGGDADDRAPRDREVTAREGEAGEGAGIALSTSRLLGTLAARWRRVVTGAALGIVAAIAYTRLATPQYEATATLRLEARQSRLPSLYEDAVPRDEVFTELEVLHSRTLAADVAHALALQVTWRHARGGIVPHEPPVRDVSIADPSDTGSVTLVPLADGRYLARERGDTVAVGEPVRVLGARLTLTPAPRGVAPLTVRVAPEQEVVARLQEEVEVSRAGLQANVIVLRYASSDPQRARDVLNAWTSRYIDRRQAIRRSEAEQTARFIVSQLDTLVPQLAAAESRLLRFRDANAVVAPDEAAVVAVRQRAARQAERDDVASEKGAIDQALARARTPAAAAGESSPYRALLGIPSLLRNQASGELLRALVTLDDQRASLLVRRTSRDPDVQALTERIAQVEQQLQDITSTYASALGARVASLDASLGVEQGRLAAIPRTELELSRLERAPRVLESLVGVLQTRLQEARLNQTVQDASVRIVDRAVLPHEPSSPHLPVALAVGLLSGALGGVATAVAGEKRRPTVRTRGDLRRATALPVIGVVPHFRESRALRMGARIQASRAPRALPRAVGSTAASSPSELAASEAYLRVVLALRAQLPPGARSVLVASALPGEGKTSMVLSMGAVAARQQQRTLLVDVDLRRGGLSRALALAHRPGVVDIAHGTHDAAECLTQLAMPGGTVTDVIGAGSLTRSANLTQTMDAVRRILQWATAYELVLFDSPPINLVADAAALAPLADGVVLVARAGTTGSPAAALAVDQLREAGGHVLGAVLNDARLAAEDGNASLAEYRAYTFTRA
ncbi:MAG: polysaccharide biosynthesis tyrosine autokinase [Gemmatimonadaceae bacterium]|nr:polysaccharide biosynthesis tyrosine autokinase [Gemmatimonadaceae bacterium]